MVRSSKGSIECFCRPDVREPSTRYSQCSHSDPTLQDLRKNSRPTSFRRKSMTQTSSCTPVRQIHSSHYILHEALVKSRTSFSVLVYTEAAYNKAN